MIDERFYTDESARHLIYVSMGGRRAGRGWRARQIREAHSSWRGHRWPTLYREITRKLLEMRLPSTSSGSRTSAASAKPSPRSFLWRETGQPIRIAGPFGGPTRGRTNLFAY